MRTDPKTDSQRLVPIVPELYEILRKARETQCFTGFCELGGGGIEPPTPGFSIVASSGDSVAVNRTAVSSYDQRPKIAESRAQQKAQHSELKWADLRILIAACPELSSAAKADILARGDTEQ